MTYQFGAQVGSACYGGNTIAPPPRVGVGPALALAFMFTTTVDMPAVAEPLSTRLERGATAYKSLPVLRADSTSTVLRQVDSLIAQVREFGAYDKGWCGEHSYPPSRSAINDAENFLRQYNWDQMILPVISMTSDGEINFIWIKDDLYVDLGFFGDQTYAFYWKRDNGVSLGGDNVDCSRELPSELMAALAR